MLFCAASGLGLINSLLVKFHYFRDKDADIVIPGGGLWDSWAEGLRATGIFKRVLTNNGVVERERAARRTWDSGDKKEAVRKILGNAEIPERPDSFFLAGDSLFGRSLYYSLSHHGTAPKLSLVEGGIASYIENISQKHHWPNMDPIAEKRLEAMYLYRPQLDYGGSGKPAFRIPMLIECAEGMRAVQRIFGKETLPEARFIFLADDTSRLPGASEHLMILDRLCAIVGKENVVVRPHPSAKEWIPLFRLHGYRVLDSDVPWEVLLTLDTQSRRIITTVASHGAMTGWFVSGKCLPILLMKNMTIISRHWYYDAPVYNNYLTAVKKAAEKECGGLFLPSNDKEMSLTIEYLRREGY